MKKLILILIFLVLAVMPVSADQYGDESGEVLGEQVIEHPAREVGAGIADMELWQVALLSGLIAVVATSLYKISYKLYIFDR